MKSIKKYFVSNESNFARRLSKWLTLLLGILTPISILNGLPTNWVHWLVLVTNFLTLAIKILIPFTGSPQNDIKILQANCAQPPISESDNSNKSL